MLFKYVLYFKKNITKMETFNYVSVIIINYRLHCVKMDKRAA